VKLEQYIHIVLHEWTNQAGKTQKWIKQMVMCPKNIAQMLGAKEKYIPLVWWTHATAPHYCWTIGVRKWPITILKAAMAKYLTSFHSMMTVELNSMEANDITDPIDIQWCRLINAHHPTLQSDQCCKDYQHNLKIRTIQNWSYLCTENDKKAVHPCSLANA